MKAYVNAALWFLVGFGVGMLDYAAIKAVGMKMEVEGVDLTFAVTTFFALNFGVLFAVIARLLAQRRELREMTDVVRAQYEGLQRTQGELAQAESLAAVGRLSSGVAHEVRNPLGVIRASASMIMEDVEPRTEAHEAAEFIRDEVDRLDAFVRRLMDYTRPLAAERRDLEVASLLERVGALSSEYALERGVSLDVACAEGARVEGDEELLCRLLVGLVRNACAAASARVEVRARVGDEVVVVEVRDDGEGVAEDAVADIFSPFYTTKADGTGLGLAMARKIASAHGATIEVVGARGLGEDGAGACFRLTLVEERSS